jgi:segregation and condensation protein A
MCEGSNGGSENPERRSGPYEVSFTWGTLVLTQLTVTLPKFEGPLDLLLYLIRKEEMDIFDIKIHEITHQYLEFIKRMRELDLEVAGEFISMASTLIHIKSRMLLPKYNDQGEVVENEDPRKELVQRLLEYQKYQDAAKTLNERPMVGRDLWLRGTREVIKPQEEEILLEDNALFSLIASYRKTLRSFQKKIHRVSRKGQSIAQRIFELKDRLIPGHRITMRELLGLSEDRARQILITFLSLLELGKMGIVTLYQAETYGDIYVDPKREIANDVISRVEEFDGLKSEEAAERLIHEAEVEAQMELPLVEDVELADLGEDNMSFGAEEMASDEEILAAESELTNLEPRLQEELPAMPRDHEGKMEGMV